MRYGRLSRIIGIALLVLPAAPFTGLAQEQAQKQGKKHKHYTLVDIGTLGGPGIFVNSIDSRGRVAGGALTSIPDPICTGPWHQEVGCYYEHAFKGRDGVLTDLGTLPGGNNSYASAANSRGVVFGVSENGLPDPIYGVRAFVATIWNDGEIQDLGTLGGGLSFPGFSINERGQAVGAASNTDPDPDGFATAVVFGPGAILPGVHWHAALWQNGAIQDLGTLGDGLDSSALFVNEHGQVAGIAYTNSVPNPETGIPTVDPFFWENGQMIDIGTLGGTLSSLGSEGAGGFNNKGQVAGTSNLAGDQSEHAFIWERGLLLDLGTLGGTVSDTGSINDSGEVVGWSTTAGDATLRAFRWKNGHMTNLGSLYDDVCSLAFGSNSKGQIVGDSIPCDIGGASHPFLWENGGPMVDLNTLIPPGSGVVLNEGAFINEKGEIVASGTLENGEGRSFLLIPKDRDDDDDADDATVATQDDLTPATASATHSTHARLTPERLAELRARFLNRHRGFGLGLLKKAN
jgi:probable HAF family extracellular repeat protein